MGLSVSPRLFQPYVLTPLALLFVAVVACHAPEYAVLHEPPAAMRPVLAEKFVAERLAHWQKRLHLREWKVRVIHSTAADLRAGTLGSIRWDTRKHQATMRVLRASEYRLPYHAMVSDLEFTVVHELLHLELSALPRSEASRTDEEHTINRLAKSLIKLDRGY